MYNPCNARKRFLLGLLCCSQLVLVRLEAAMVRLRLALVYDPEFIDCGLDEILVMTDHKDAALELIKTLQCTMS